MENKEAIQRLVALKEFSSEHDLKNIGKALDMAYTALEVTSRVWIKKSWKGKWIEKDGELYCSKCDHIIPDCAGNATPIFENENRFCYYCGAPMTDKAVDLVMERFKKYNDLCGEIITFE